MADMSERRIKKVEFTFDANSAAQYAACSVCGKSSAYFFFINGITYCWEHLPAYADGPIVPLSQHTAETFQANIEAAFANGRAAGWAECQAQAVAEHHVIELARAMRAADKSVEDAIREQDDLAISESELTYQGKRYAFLSALDALTPSSGAAGATKEN